VENRFGFRKLFENAGRRTFFLQQEPKYKERREPKGFVPSIYGPTDLCHGGVEKKMGWVMVSHYYRLG